MFTLVNQNDEIWMTCLPLSLNQSSYLNTELKGKKEMQRNNHHKEYVFGSVSVFVCGGQTKT